MDLASDSRKSNVDLNNIEEEKFDKIPFLIMPIMISEELFLKMWFYRKTKYMTFMTRKIGQ